MVVRRPSDIKPPSPSPSSVLLFSAEFKPFPLLQTPISNHILQLSRYGKQSLSSLQAVRSLGFCSDRNDHCCIWLQALPNQTTVDYPSFKLVIVGDGGTGTRFSLFSLFSFNIVFFLFFVHSYIKFCQTLTFAVFGWVQGRPLSWNAIWPESSKRNMNVRKLNSFCDVRDCQWLLGFFVCEIWIFTVWLGELQQRLVLRFIRWTSSQILGRSGSTAGTQLVRRSLVDSEMVISMSSYHNPLF